MGILGSGRDGGIRWNCPGLGEFVPCSSGIISITGLMWQTLNIGGKSPDFAGPHNQTALCVSRYKFFDLRSLFSLQYSSFPSACWNTRLLIMFAEVSFQVLLVSLSTSESLRNSSFHSNLFFNCKFPHQLTPKCRTGLAL